MKAKATLNIPSAKAGIKPNVNKTASVSGNSPVAVNNTDNSWEVQFSAPATKVYTVSDSKIRKSNGDLIVSLPATIPYEVPDSVGVNGDGSELRVRATEGFICQTLQTLINGATAAILKADLDTALKLGGVIALLATSDLTANLSGQQVNDFIQALSASTIFNDLTEQQQDDIIPLFPSIEIDENITTLQVTGLGAANVQKLIQAQIITLINAQLAMLSDAQKIEVITNVCSAQFINDHLSQATRNSLNKIYCQKTGETTNYRTGADGALQAGRLGFGALPLNNSFGNTTRYTNSLGGNVKDGSDGSIAGYSIDHGTGLGWTNNIQSTALSWNAAVDAALVFSIGGLSGFRLPNYNELKSLYNLSINPPYNYAPFSFSATVFWVSTTTVVNTSNAWRITVGNELATAKNATNVASIIYCRTHF